MLICISLSLLLYLLIASFRQCRAIAIAVAVDMYTMQALYTYKYVGTNPSLVIEIIPFGFRLEAM